MQIAFSAHKQTLHKKPPIPLRAEKFDIFPGYFGPFFLRSRFTLQLSSRAQKIHHSQQTRQNKSASCPLRLLFALATYWAVSTPKKGKKNRDLVFFFFLPFSSRVVRARGLCFFLCFHVENSLKTVESRTGGRNRKNRRLTRVGFYAFKG
jgi:hypothetical protein